MDLAHQLTHGGIHLLVALDAVQPGKLLADDHCLVVGLLTTTVHVAFVEHLQVLRRQGAQLLFNALLHGHRGVLTSWQGRRPCQR